jgi:multiple sugar transport system substrate-binding protein
MKFGLKKILATTALVAFATGAQAEETVVWWDFLGGGDGIRMKTLIDEFNAGHAGDIQIEATTLDWGVPFYTKVQTSAAVGEGPDVMTYHTSRIPLAVSQNVLDEITADDWAALGLGESDFAPAIWEAVTLDGKQYAIPLDTHPIVLYYNKDKLEAAGLIGDDGKPTGLDGILRRDAGDSGRRHYLGRVDVQRLRRFPVPHHLLAALPAGRRDDHPRRMACR